MIKKKKLIFHNWKILISIFFKESYICRKSLCGLIRALMLLRVTESNMKLRVETEKENAKNKEVKIWLSDQLF